VNGENAEVAPPADTRATGVPDDEEALELRDWKNEPSEAAALMPRGLCMGKVDDDGVPPDLGSTAAAAAAAAASASVESRVGSTSPDAPKGCTVAAP